MCFQQLVFALITVLQCLSFVDNATQKESEVAISKLVRELIDELVYNRDIRPNFGVKPLEVKVSLEVYDISSISEVSMDFTVDFVFRQYWHDSRLSFAPLENTKHMTLGVEFASKIWRPNTFLTKSKRLEQQASVGQFNSLIRLAYTGEVLYSVRMIAVATCSMDLTHFPADQQICTLQFESYDYTVEDLQYEWLNSKESSIQINQISLPTFTLTKFRPRISNRTNLHTGTFSQLAIDFHFSRSLGFYLYQIYIPAFLIVVISWIPFWLNRDHHARVGLGVTTVLTITTLTTSTMESLPKVSYIKAIDIYLFACFLMVFLSLIEYATVGFFEYKHNQSRNSSKDNSCSDKHRNNKIEKNRQRVNQWAWQTSRIDFYSRTAFPLVFIGFNLVYASYILYVI